MGDSGLPAHKWKPVENEDTSVRKGDGEKKGDAESRGGIKGE